MRGPPTAAATSVCGAASPDRAARLRDAVSAAVTADGGTRGASLPTGDPLRAGQQFPAGGAVYDQLRHVREALRIVHAPQHLRKVGRRPVAEPARRQPRQCCPVLFKALFKALFATLFKALFKALFATLFAAPCEAALLNLIHTPVQYRTHRTNISPVRRFPQLLQQVGPQSAIRPRPII